MTPRTPISSQQHWPDNGKCGVCERPWPCLESKIEQNKQYGLLCACNKVRVPFDTRELLVGTTLHGYDNCEQVKP